MRTQILGVGHYLPEKRLTNADLEKMVETNDQWIVERTGIRERRIAPPEHATSDLATIAATRALSSAGVSPQDLDMIILATASGDHIMPAPACLVQARIGATNCVAFDLSAACSGFVFAASVADKYIKSGTHKRILVIGAETLSRIVNWKDRETCILFGDGAGAAVLGPAQTDSKSEILSEFLLADGTLSDLLTNRAGGSRLPLTHDLLDQGAHLVTMKGRDIFKNAVRTMSKCASHCLEKASMTLDDVHWIIPHQANQRIIEAVAKQMDIPREKIIMNLERTGNTSAASVPVALSEALENKIIKRGDVILITVFGAGLTSGALLLRY
ncbi:MAG: ketoacyl-ACP synthase III [Oligoflexia bacterium]|nr:ketoacyl-ACP synthase III [Oligoflexia bacterium]